jgi:hypothetical protein
MAMPTSAALPRARSEPQTRTVLLLESIVRHKIAVLERSGKRRPCFSPLGSAALDLVRALVANGGDSQFSNPRIRRSSLRSTVSSKL